MGIELKNRGCLGYLHLSIERADLLHVHRATNRDEAVSLYDRVSDWFCGTQKAEATRLLFDVYSRNTPTQTKVDSFYALKALAGDNYKNRFMIEPLERWVLYIIEVDRDAYGTIEFRAGFFDEPSHIAGEGDPLLEH